MEYARTALTKLEQDALHVLAPGRRVELQTDLNHKREQLELLFDRLQDLHKASLIELAVNEDESANSFQMAVDPEDDEDEGDDILASIIATPSVTSTASTNTDVTIATPSAESSIHDLQPQPDPDPEPPTPQAPSAETPTETTSTLRPRASHKTAREALFASRRPKSPSAAEPATTTATAEAILSREASEREYLAESVLRMAQAMKKKQIDIAADLENEKDVLGRATEGMERAGRAMDTVRGAMGAITKMAEGEGWWGRLMLYAWIYGLMVLSVLLVFVFPKLRF